MTVLATLWYASGTFWTGALSATIALVSLIVTRRSATPTRRLTYSMPLVARMITAPDSLHSGLEVRHLGESVRDPYIIEVRLVASGQRDIPSTAFDRDKPLRLDVHVRIVNLLEIAMAPETVSAPKLKVDGTAVEVPPCRIDRRQQITVSMVVDGQPKLTCESPLVDVDIQKEVAVTAGTLEESTQMGGSVILMSVLLAWILTAGAIPSWVIIVVLVTGLVVGGLIYRKGRRDLTGTLP